MKLDNNYIFLTIIVLKTLYDRVFKIKIFINMINLFKNYFNVCF